MKEIKEINTYEEYLKTLDETQKQWQIELDNYILNKYKKLKITIFRQRPMFKFSDSYLKGYIMFSCSKSHFTMHVLDFDAVLEFKEKTKGLKFGKGSIKIPYNKTEFIPLLKELVDYVIIRSSYFKDK